MLKPGMLLQRIYQSLPRHISVEILCPVAVGHSIFCVILDSSVRGGVILCQDTARASLIVSAKADRRITHGLPPEKPLVGPRGACSSLSHLCTADAAVVAPNCQNRPLFNEITPHETVEVQGPRIQSYPHEYARVHALYTTSGRQCDTGASKANRASAVFAWSCFGESQSKGGEGDMWLLGVARPLWSSKMNCQSPKVLSVEASGSRVTIVLRSHERKKM